MNRILFEKSEIVDGFATFGGERAEHVMNVLHGEVGQILKTGEVDGPVGTSEIVEIGEADKLGEAESLPLQNKDLKNSINSGGRDSSAPIRIRVRVNHAEASIRPWIDLVLAPPRPRVMKRLLPQLATMGVGRIVLVGAQKVEKDFWGATLLKEENYRPLLIDGLMQGGTSIIPKIECWKSFNRFLREGLSSFSSQDRIVAHPYVEEVGETSWSGRKEIRNSAVYNDLEPRPLLAIGPEGGWTDEEVEKLFANGFRGYSLGSRILRTDTATIALLAQLMQKYEKVSES